MSHYVNLSIKTNADPDRDPEDFYATSPPATLGLLRLERFRGPIWECACGDGAMSDVLIQKGHRVVSTDLYDRGYGETGVDFLAQTRTRAPNIVTNPPFKHAIPFVRTAMQLATRKVAMIFRLAILEGQTRYREIYTQFPPSRVLVFPDRPAFWRSGDRTYNGGPIAMTWLVWDAEHVGETVVRWIPPNAGETK